MKEKEKELIKVRDMSLKYAISARALKYYEDMGLITSTRRDDYAYRMYDEEAVKRLEQILILRKLNISIKDIQRIFSTSGSETVLEVLNQKVENIDEEVALLHDLKEIVLEFIRQINRADFSRDSDVKMLYEKAKEIETQIVNVEYEGNPSDVTDVNRLLEVTEKLDDKRITLPTAIKAYRQEVGAMRFIGKKYSDGGTAWNNWCYVNDSKLLREKLNINLKDLYEDGDSLIGLMSHRDGFEYWLGYFTPAGTTVPEGYDYEDFPEMPIGTAWLYGKEDEVFAIEPMAYEKIGNEGFEYIPGVDWWWEKYHPVRTIPDKKGNIIIDICFFVATDADAVKIREERLAAERKQHERKQAFVAKYHDIHPNICDVGVYENGMENWQDRNAPNHPPATQILIMLNNSRITKAMFDNMTDLKTRGNYTFTFEITPEISDGNYKNETRKIVLPISTYNEGLMVLRFEPVRGASSAENRFIPEKGVRYEIVLEICDNLTGERWIVWADRPYMIDVNPITE